MFVGWIIIASKDAKKRAKEREDARNEMDQVALKAAYDKGKHDSVHDKIEVQVNSAHNKLRDHEIAIEKLRQVDVAHIETQKAILERMDRMNHAQMEQMTQIHATIDTIHRVIMSNNTKGKG
jgi:hypothetical protein